MNSVSLLTDLVSSPKSRDRAEEFSGIDLAIARRPERNEIAICRACGNTASNEELLKKLCSNPDKCPL